MLISVDTQNARVTRAQAAELAGVSMRQINRWSADGLLRVWHDPKFRKPAMYDRAEVERIAQRAKRMKDVPLPEADIST
jgi:predicted site-specific integrase-resolvase